MTHSVDRSIKRNEAEGLNENKVVLHNFHFDGKSYSDGS